MKAVTKLDTQPQDAESTRGKVGHHNGTGRKSQETSAVPVCVSYANRAKNRERKPIFLPLSCFSSFLPAFLMSIVSIVFRRRLQGRSGNKLRRHSDATVTSKLCSVSKARTKTVTMTTLIEDGSNKCQASGPVGMSDGVITPRKNIGNLIEG